MNPRNAGFTLTEVMISTMIVGMLMAGVMASMTSALDYNKLGEAQDDLAVSGRRIVKKLSDDIAVSAWFVPQSKQFTSDPVADRSARYYPYVQIQSYAAGQGAGGLGLGFPHHTRSATMVELPHVIPPISESDKRHRFDNLPGDRGDYSRDYDGMNVASMDSFKTSFYARSQELILLRCAMGRAPGDVSNVLFPQKNPDGWRVLPGGVTKTNQTPHNALGILKMDEYQRAEVEAGSTPDISKYGSVGGKFYRKKPNGNGADTWNVFDQELPTAWLNWNGGAYMVNLRWETLEPIDNSMTTNPPVDPVAYPGYTGVGPVSYTNVSTQNSNIPLISILREYSYVVVPSKLGVGRLVRCVKQKFLSPPVITLTPGPEIGQVISSAIEPDDNPTGDIYGMVVDKVLSDDVARITFDTIRTSRIPAANDVAVYGAQVAAMIQQNALDVNQIRIRIYMIKEHRVNGEDLCVYNRFDSIVQMQASCSASNVAADRLLHQNMLPAALQH